ncbi:prolactin [Xenopus tropicalis]|uniref:Prolactin n=1 Tax=Xenopus tropicalis TaxID=8364 RepID=A0A8J1JWY0_XENTR|nr:prolactin [Xenopus tropicalis]
MVKEAATCIFSNLWDKGAVAKSKRFQLLLTFFILVPQHDDLIDLVQKLLRSWNQPLQHLALEAPDNMASKVKEVEEHAKILQGGIDRIAGRMQSNLGDDFYPQWFGPLDPRMPKGDSESYALYHLLHCFRRDSNKIDNYLKILRCRMVHASNC